MKNLSLIFLIGITTTLHARPLNEIVTVKERLRIQLWVEGIEEKKDSPKQQHPSLYLPEEILIPLEKI